MQIEAQLKQLSFEELRRVIEEAQRALELKQKQKREEVIRQIRELAAQAGLEVEVRVKPKMETKPVRRGAKLPPKYRHPNDPALTWSGRGQMPAWLKDLVAQGRDREEFRVQG
ncbi:MAG: H-NS histone family protein [Methylohalobius sp.]|nr:H-NS histone family protein [Methylohalobius sp.]